MNEHMFGPLGAAAASVSGFGWASMANAAISNRAAEEFEASRLALAARPDVLASALEEVERRAEVFTQTRSGAVATHSDTPRLAALRSVIEDIITGRF